MAQIKCFSLSQKGASHIAGEQVCQDCAGHDSNDASDSIRYAIIAVSDGHGGGKYFRSDRGSRVAVAKAQEAIKEYIMNQKSFHTLSYEKKDTALSKLEESVISMWGKAIESHLDEHCFTDAELMPLDEDTKMKMRDTTKFKDYWYRAYGATLIAAVVCDDFWFGFQIGDGTFTVRENGQYRQPIPLDEKCVGTNTTSICDQNAIRYFHHDWGHGMPEAVFIATDGVDESFATVGGLYKFYDSVIANSREDWEGNLKELEAYLPTLSEKGSRDDVSLAAIISL